MNVRVSRSAFHLGKGQKIVIGFYLTFVLSVSSWISIWGPKGTTLFERIWGEGPEKILLYIPLVPSLVCLVFLLILQGLVSNSPPRFQLPTDQDLDERQLIERNVAYQKAYMPVCILFLVVAAYIALSSTLGLPLPNSLGQGWGIFMIILLVVTSFPLVVLAWRQK